MYHFVQCLSLFNGRRLDVVESEFPYRLICKYLIFHVTRTLSRFDNDTSLLDNVGGFSFCLTFRLSDLLKGFPCVYVFFTRWDCYIKIKVLLRVHQL